MTQLTSKPVLEGYLYKKGYYNTSWKRRYFVLYEDRTLDYFKDKSHSMHRNKAKGIIKLTHVQQVELMQYIHSKSPCNSPITGEGTLEFVYPHAHLTDVISSLHPPPSYSNIIKSGPNQQDNKHKHAVLKKCERPHAFALISNSREWKLSADTDKELKMWITALRKLCQGDEIFNGYLNDETKSSSKHYVLYRNKLLNCYKNNKIESAVDLKRILYLKYDRYLTIELAISNRDKSVILTAPNTQNATLWYNKIRSMFDENKIICSLFHTLSESVHIVHSKKHLQNTYISIYTDYVALFRNIDRLEIESVQNMQFFDRRIFRDYLTNIKCILIPMNENIKARKASKAHGANALMLSNITGDRKWYISVQTKEILKTCMNILVHKIRVISPKKKQSKSIVSKQNMHDSVDPQQVLSFMNDCTQIGQEICTNCPSPRVTLRVCKSLPAILETTSSP